MKTKKKKRSTKGKRGSRTWAYPAEFRLRIVKLFLEEEYSASLLSEQFGISRSAIRRWVRLYRQRGVEGLEIKRRACGNTRVTPEVRQRMVAVKKAHPEYGPRRIADVLKRFFLIPTSQSTVHKTLSEKGLVNKAKRKPVKNPPKPRFFERARPNQLWQSDIMTFRLAGRNAYLHKLSPGMRQTAHVDDVRIAGQMIISAIAVTLNIAQVVIENILNHLPTSRGMVLIQNNR